MYVCQKKKNPCLLFSRLFYQLIPLPFSFEEIILTGCFCFVSRSRFMRKIDRERNGMDFPKLFFPEIYLLHGGYKNFYASHPVSLSL